MGFLPKTFNYTENNIDILLETIKPLIKDLVVSQIKNYSASIVAINPFINNSSNTKELNSVLNPLDVLVKQDVSKTEDQLNKIIELLIDQTQQDNDHQFELIDTLNNLLKNK